MRVILAALALAAAAPAAAGLIPSAGVLPRPPFPAPATDVAPTRSRLMLVSSRYIDPGTLPPEGPAPPAWAPRRYAGDPLQDVIRKGDKIYLLYGPDGSTNRYVGVGHRSARSLFYVLDFKRFLRPPNGGEPEGVLWAHEGVVVSDAALYVSNGHFTYASATRGRTAYITAIDPVARKTIWRSPALVANARTFVVTDDYIVSGYGFTREPDFLYLLDRRTGRVLDRLPVPSAPEVIRLRGDRLEVRTYDRKVVARIVR